MIERADIVVVGAGAAGLMAACWAARTRPSSKVVVLDGASKLGAKILVAGGGRCNVTHDVVDDSAYAGSTRPAIRKVLRRFDVPETVAFFEALGVALKREETGKLFPTTDRARTILDALIRAVEQAGGVLRYPRRVERVERSPEGFVVGGAWGELRARRVILATGGQSLPKSGSDGYGYVLARRLGHSLTPRITPALVPLLLPVGHPLTALSGVSADVRISLHDGHGKLLQAFEGALLCTHFGVSGPAVLDISRYVLDLQASDQAIQVRVNWIPGLLPEQVDATLLGAGKRSVLRWLDGRLPERLARMLCAEAGIEPAIPLNSLSRVQRQALTRALTAYPLPVRGSRGYTYAEVTAGGIPLSELNLKTMESRVCAGLHLCGELCDVDGRIGGYNFQWAWASGYTAGVGAAELLGSQA